MVDEITTTPTPAGTGTGTARRSDHELLVEYARSRCQEAFAALVERHLSLVYWAARRQVRDSHAAQDVAQAVFCVLAGKAASLGSDAGLVLPAWLWRTTRLASLAAMRRERRLKRRERNVAQMDAARRQVVQRESPNTAWDDLSLDLDAAMAELREVDRRALILRFFEERPLREVGESLGISEDAAKQRVSRAVAKLRGILEGGGLRIGTTGALSVLLAASAAQPAPAGLGARIAAVGGGADVAPAVHFILHAMAASKFKAALVALAVAVSGIAATVLVMQVATKPSRGARGTLAPATTATTRVAADDWRSRFKAAYALADGEVLKRVAPPYIPERQRLFDQLDPGRRYFDPRAGYLLVWDGKVNWMDGLRGPLGQHTLWLLLTYGLDFPSYSLDVPPELRGMRLSGDWVVRKGARDADRLAAFAEIMKRDWGRAVRFENRTMEREVLVTRGDFKPARDANGPPILDLFTIERPTGNARVEGDLTGLLRTAGELCGLAIVHEGHAADAKVAWRFGSGVRPGGELDAENVTRLLDHISEQTGLEFHRAIRPVSMWVASEVP